MNAGAVPELIRARVDLDAPTLAGDNPLALAAKNSLAQRIRQWVSGGGIDRAAASYTIEDGVMTFRMKGRARKISPRDERIMALRLGARAHGPYLFALVATIALAKKANLAVTTADGTPVTQLLADLKRPDLAKVVSKRGVSLPAPRAYRRVERPCAP